MKRPLAVRTALPGTTQEGPQMARWAARSWTAPEGPPPPAAAAASVAVELGASTSQPQTPSAPPCQRGLCSAGSWRPAGKSQAHWASGHSLASGGAEDPRRRRRRRQLSFAQGKTPRGRQAGRQAGSRPPFPASRDSRTGLSETGTPHHFLLIRFSSHKRDPFSPPPPPPGGQFHSSLACCWPRLVQT